MVYRPMRWDGGESDSWGGRESGASRMLEGQNRLGMRKGDNRAILRRLKDLGGRMLNRGWCGKSLGASL